MEPSRSSPPRKSLPRKLLALVAALFAVVYLLNPGAGFVELVPDNLPFVGNLDEAGLTALLLYSLRYMFSRPRPG